MILRQLYRTEVFTNAGGGVCIKQESYELGKEVQIVLYGDQIELLGMELCRLAKENQFSIFEDEEESE